MNYYILRNGEKFGPYTLAALQGYVASGNIVLTDLACSEGMDTWVPVSQVLGNIPAAIPVHPTQAQHHVQLTSEIAYPDPPGLSWIVVLLLAVVSCGVFTLVWNIVISVWLRKVKPDAKALIFYVAGLVVAGIAFFFKLTGVEADMEFLLTPLFRLTECALLIIGAYYFKSDFEEHYTKVTGVSFSMNPVMTFFFGSLYFQYHINDFLRLKYLDYGLSY